MPQLFPVHQHAQHLAEGEGSLVGVPPAGAIVVPFGMTRSFHGTVVHVGAAGIGGEEAEGAVVLTLAFDPDAIVFEEV